MSNWRTRIMSTKQITIELLCYYLATTGRLSS